MAADSQVFLIYCDESSITGDRYMIIGGLVINSKALLELKALIGEYRKNYGMIYELKWGKISINRLEHYKALIDIIFDLIDEGRINFRCAVFDTTKFNHKRFNDGDSELGFYKMYYHLLFYAFGTDYHQNKNRFVVYPDQKPGKYNLFELKNRLNNNMFYKLGNRQSPFGSIESTNSKKSDFIQIVDILLGAIAYHINKKHKLDNASAAKVEMANYISGKVKQNEFKAKNFKYKKNNRFTIWNFNLQ